MTNFDFKKVLSAYLTKQGIEHAEVVEWEENVDKARWSGCDTCGYGADEDKYSVDIYYKRSTAKRSSKHVYSVEGTFAEFLDVLTGLEVPD